MDSFLTSVDGFVGGVVKKIGGDDGESMGGNVRVARDAGGGEVKNTKEDVLSVSGAGVTSGELSEGRVGERHLHRRGSGFFNRFSAISAMGSKIGAMEKNTTGQSSKLLDNIILLLWGYIGLDNIRAYSVVSKPDLSVVLFIMNGICFGILFMYIYVTSGWDARSRFGATAMALTHIIWLSFSANILMYNKINDPDTIRFFNVAVMLLLGFTTVGYLWSAGKFHLRFWMLWVFILFVITLSMAAFITNLQGHGGPAMGCGMTSFVLSLIFVCVWSGLAHKLFHKVTGKDIGDIDTYSKDAGNTVRKHLNTAKYFGRNLSHLTMSDVQKHERNKSRQKQIDEDLHNERSVANSHMDKATELGQRAQFAEGDTKKLLEKEMHYHKQKAHRHTKNAEALKADSKQFQLKYGTQSSYSGINSDELTTSATPVAAAPPAQTREDTMQTLNIIHSRINELNTIQNNDPKLITTMQELYNNIKQCNPQDNSTREYLTNYKNTFNVLLKMHINVQTHEKNYQKVKQLKKLQPFQ